MVGPEGFYPIIDKDDQGIIVTLPEWVNRMVFDELGGIHNPARNKRSFDNNLEATDTEVRTYLGTYFPRSLAESYLIFDCLLSDKSYANVLAREDRISICSVGTGTGGDLLGLLLALDRRLAKATRVEIVSIEGNPFAHDMMCRTFNTVSPFLRSVVSLGRVDYTFRPPMPFDKPREFLPPFVESYDFILSSKMLNELDGSGVSRQPYLEFCRAFAPRLSENGTLLVLDVTSANSAGGRWTPQQLNNQVNRFLTESNEFKTIIPLLCNRFESKCNRGCYTQNSIHVAYRVSQNIRTKICYRVIGRTGLAERLANSPVLWNCLIAEDNRQYCRAFRG